MSAEASAGKSLGQRIDSWHDLFTFRDQEVHVVGAASVEGAHLLLFLLDHGFTRLVAHDFNAADDFDRIFSRVHVGWVKAEREAMLARIHGEAELRHRDRYLEGIEDADAIAVTQGWYLYDANQVLIDSAGLQARFFSLAQLYLALAPGRVVGVSGSQGKSTTTHLLGGILAAHGLDVIAAGNDRHGQQALGRLEHAGPDSILLLEISNRHLKMLDRSPGVAVLTNIHPNHLDEHGGWDGYVDAKSKLVRYQRPGDIAVLNADQDVSRQVAADTSAAIAWFGSSVDGAKAPGVAVAGDRLQGRGKGFDGFEMAADRVPIPGRHNLYNAAAAATAALAMGASADAIDRAIAGFRGLKHRLQFVWEANRVRYFDDLNSTTPTATEAALETLGHDVVWIFGGDDKGLDPSGLVAAAQPAVRLALALPGAGSDGIARPLNGAGVAIEQVLDLETAVRRAVEVARPGDKVLLSPACPGFFSRFYVGVSEDVGFRRMVRAATLGGGDRGPVAGLPAGRPAEATSPPARRPRR